MKKFYLIPLAGLLLASCANDDLKQGTGSESGEGEAAIRDYISVNIIPTKGFSSRAASYENGSTIENNVNMVRFYFFNATGESTPVWNKRASSSDAPTTQEFNSYIDWYPNNSDIGSLDPTDKGIEKVLTATLGINYPKGYNEDGEHYPKGVVAILNPTSDLLNNEFTPRAESGVNIYGPSLEELQEVVNDYLTGLDYTKVGNFVISNSVYVNGTDEVIATPISTDNLALSPDQIGEDEGMKKPLSIYVERVLARLDFGVAIPGTTENPNITVANGDGTNSTLYYVGSYTINYFQEGSFGDGTTGSGTVPIYVKLLGWNTTQTANESRLIKGINTAWTDEVVFGVTGEPWNSADYHRSFWAINPDDPEFDYNYGNFGFMFDQYTGPNVVNPDDYPNVLPASRPIPAPATPTVYDITYLQENANPYSQQLTAAAPTNPTDVIIAAQLVNADGEALPIAEFAYNKYTPDGLLVYLAANNLSQLYRVENSNTDDNPETHIYISPGDLTYTPYCPDAASQQEEYDYYSYVVLGTTAATYTWYLNGVAFENSAAVNKYIFDSINHVRIWNSGMTYYFFPVEHLGAPEKPGYYGIVRNHIYRTTVTSIKGLGTPVYNPNIVIIPEKNEYEESVVKADIKILQWRLVNSTYDLEWQ